MTGRGAVPDVPTAPPNASPSTPPLDASQRAAAEEPGADGSDAVPAAPGDASAASDAASDGASDRSGEPPPDAATTFEDLPYDLFGEHEPEADAPPPVPADAEAARGAASRDRPAQRPAPAATDAPPDETGDDAIEIVQTLFPGRIVAIESSPAPGVEDDDGARDEESGPRTTDDFASGTSG